MKTCLLNFDDPASSEELINMFYSIVNLANLLGDALSLEGFQIDGMSFRAELSDEVEYGRVAKVRWKRVDSGGAPLEFYSKRFFHLGAWGYNRFFLDGWTANLSDVAFLLLDDFLQEVSLEDYFDISSATHVDIYRDLLPAHT
jgi:hypothetical protein